MPATAAGPDTAPVAVLTPVPLLPGHSSTEAERNAFRSLAEPVWERYGAAVTRTLSRLPALRGREQESARVDLIALQLYLRTREGPLADAELQRALRDGDARLLPYAACVASGLRRLPSFRGTVLRGAAPGWDALPVGSVLREPAPASALPLNANSRYSEGPCYAIWSASGRRIRQLVDAPSTTAAHDEVVFPPGSAFRVLGVRSAESGAPMVLLRELPVPRPGAPVRQGPLDEQDRAALARLDESLSRLPAAAAGPGTWPDRCSGPLGPHTHGKDR
ncbi:hypothetical protein [Streptomyces sp. GC420]|uniref:hypothetical protein n=1 Tax=Streptomyces sp. GC420 TaxID=2697568 RepID=UPI0014150A90|nr:hypothetical protein [Streptomyces sp. GC420]NBM18126.1 hypothetical protein [Streptomyces sp. GC420]